MIKKNIRALSVLVAATVIALPIAGCSNQSESEEAATSSVSEEIVVTSVEAGVTPEEEKIEEAEAAPLVAETVELKTIGDPSDAVSGYTMNVINKTGHSIKGVSVKTSREDSYPESMLTDGDIFDIEETRILYYDPIGSGLMGSTDSSETYSVLLTFDDDSEVEIRQFPFDYTDSVEIHLDLTGVDTDTDKVSGYLIYTSNMTDEIVDTRLIEIDEDDVAGLSQSGNSSSGLTDTSTGTDGTANSTGTDSSASNGAGTGGSNDSSATNGSTGSTSTGATGDGSGSDSNNRDAYGGYYGLDSSGYYYENGEGGRYYNDGTTQWYLSPSGTVIYDDLNGDGYPG